ncbi:hypothetical protein J2X24_003726 [Asticcacaulis solisilvae]|nr:hypothetical protein [Asticcacaulis solisilvae]MDR6802189.1 hypothetical protein [Asticcacaulis sp. BE141]
MPETLRELAARLPFTRPDNTLYPGLNAPVPLGYGQQLIQVLRRLRICRWQTLSHL